MPITNVSFIEIRTDVFNDDIPVVICLEVLSRHRLILDFANKVIGQKRKSWKIPVVFKHCQIFLTWTALDVFLNQEYLKLLNLNLFNFAIDKIFNLIRRALPDEADSKQGAKLTIFIKLVRSVEITTCGHLVSAQRLLQTSSFQTASFPWISCGSKIRRS